MYQKHEKTNEYFKLRKNNCKFYINDCFVLISELHKYVIAPLTFGRTINRKLGNSKN